MCPSCVSGANDCSTPHKLSRQRGHWWNGWPGAYCMGCGAEDPQETCLADNCSCECHPEPPAN